LHPVPNLNDTAHSTFVEQMPPLSEGSPLGSIPVRGAKIDEMPETPETLEGSNLADPLA
jgi:hypothetical protein